MDLQAFPYPRDAIRTHRELVVAAALGNFTTHSWTIARDQVARGLVVVCGTIGVTNTPLSVTPERRFPWHQFHTQPVPLTQDAARLAQRVNREVQIMRDVIADGGGRVLIDSGPIDADDIAYEGTYQRIAPVKRFRQALADYAAQSVMPIGDTLFRVV